MRLLIINTQTLPLPAAGNRLNNNYRRYSIRNRAKIKIIRDTVRATNPTIVIFSETKHISTEQATSFKLASNYRLLMETHNTQHIRQGGIIVMQKKGTATIYIDTIIASINGLHSVSVMLNVNTADVILTAVYGPNETADQMNSAYFNEINTTLSALTLTSTETKIVADYDRGWMVRENDT